MKFIIPISASWFLLVCGSPVFAGRLSIEFAGGAREVALAWGETVRVDIVWTMQLSDTPDTRVTGVNLRFNVNDMANPDGSDRDDAFVVDSLFTDVLDWDTAATSGIGGFFSEFGLFLSSIDPDAVVGVIADGTEFRTVVASFELRQAGVFAGDTYITLRHHGPNDILPDVTQQIDNYDGNLEWRFRWQEEPAGRFEFDLGLGNPGDGGPQWAVQGLEPFEPLVIHSDGSGPPPGSDPRVPDGAGDGGTSGEDNVDGGTGVDDTTDEDDADGGAGVDGLPPRPSPFPPTDSGDDPTPLPDESSNDAYDAPDWDNDGVSRYRDLCPQTARGKAVDANGCSIDDPMRPKYDDDGDGVNNPLDDCPRTKPGDLADRQGCSFAQRDDDRDGVRNASDFCAGTDPDEKVNHLGCPQSRIDDDLDGVANEYDLCPDSPSGQEVERDGCPAERPVELLPPAAQGSATGAGCGAVGMIPPLCFAALFVVQASRLLLVRRQV